MPKLETSLFSFNLSDEFVAPYATRKVDWGYSDAAGNSVGEITFLRTYSRLKEDGTKERWHEVCRRVVDGVFSIQKDHCKTNRLPWNDHKAQKSAQEMFERMFCFKWLPPGRGLWMMGTPLVMTQRNSAALQNCAFISTGDMTRQDPAWPFLFLMEASMLGIGVGFDAKGADKNFRIYTPRSTYGGDYEHVYEIPDTREGWVESVRLLLESYLKPDKNRVDFGYDGIRKAGEPIKGFGGTAAGPEPLMRLHRRLREVLAARVGYLLESKDIADIGNLIGACVVAGNVRRSAELFQGEITDESFLNLKNPEVYPERNVYSEDPELAGWGWMSNNSVAVEVGTDLAPVIEGIARNGEPGVVWLDLSRQYGRLIDPPTNADWRVAGYNPCAEQSLESGECCTLVETFLTRHESLDDFKRTLKFAYLYAKTVTLLPTHWPKTNAIMQRNRRIGTSVSGVANFTDIHGMTVLRDWLNQGYATICGYDKSYSEWMCVRESIKKTTVKPGGTTPLLPGSSSGAHWTPGGEYFDRAMRFGKDDPMVPLFRMANYRVEVSVTNPDTTVVVYFPIHSEAKRSEKDVSLFEKANLAVLLQRYWSDNSVSVTLSFDAKNEAEHVGTVLHMHDGQLKTVSFLPMGNDTYPQMPYAQIDEQEYEDAKFKLFPIDFAGIYNGLGVDAIGEAYCTTDSCLVELR